MGFFYETREFGARMLFFRWRALFPGIEIFLALYNFLLCTAYKPNAKIKNLPVGHQPSDPLDLCLNCSFLS
jgi:hypothetical protein